MMGNARFTRFFGPSAHHAQPCIELAFDNRPAAVPAATIAALTGRGTGDAPLSLGEAVRELVDWVITIRSNAFLHCVEDAKRARVGLGDTRLQLARQVLADCHAGALRLADGSDAGGLRELRRRVQAFDKDAEWVACAARKQGLDTCFVERSGTVMQLGWGAASRRVSQGTYEGDDLVGYMVSLDKQRTNELLGAIGLPVPRGATVTEFEHAKAVARKVGYPCVAKPVATAKGVGVSTDIRDDKMLEVAWGFARKTNPYPVLVEEHIEGTDHRLYVAEGKLLWVFRREPPMLVGDGTSSVAQLVETENRRRRDSQNGLAEIFHPLHLGNEELAFLRSREGLGPDDVPSDGRRIRLLGQANIARGGLGGSVTHEAHPDYRELAEIIAEQMGLVACGIDVMTRDISRSWKGGDCRVIEVNSHPGYGPPAAAIALRGHLPGRLSGRVPTVAVPRDDQLSYEAVRAALDAHGLQPFTLDWIADAHGRHRTERRAAMLDKRVRSLIVRHDAATLDREGWPVTRADLAILAQDDPHPPGIEHLEAATVRGPLDRTSATAALVPILDAYAADPPGGRWPTVELLENGRTLRCWRPRAVADDELTNILGLAIPGKRLLIGADRAAELIAVMAGLDTSPKLARTNPDGDDVWWEYDVSTARDAEVLAEAVERLNTAINELA